MADITTRVLDEDDWQVFRDLRLAALRDAPDAFVASYEDEADSDESFWRDRITDASRFVAARDGEHVGLVSLGLHHGDVEVGEVFGLWSAPDARGTHIARQLVDDAIAQARSDGRRRVYFWVGSDNVAAIGFASSYGFRPTSERRPKRGDVEAPDDEVAMVMSLSDDPTAVKNPFD